MMHLTRRQAIVAGLSALVAAALPWPVEPASDVTIEGRWGAAGLQVGDVFTIEGRYAINPTTHATTTMLQVFVVTAVAADSTSVAIWPGGEQVCLSNTEPARPPSARTSGQKWPRANHRSRPWPSPSTRHIPRGRRGHECHVPSVG